MENKYIGIGFMFLCLAILVGTIGIFGYQFVLNKESVDISPVTNINQPNNTTVE